jgi:hypothetical protein
MAKDAQAKHTSGDTPPTPSQLWRERLNKNKQDKPANGSGAKNARGNTKSGPAASTSPDNSNRKARKGFRAG